MTVSIGTCKISASSVAAELDIELVSVLIGTRKLFRKSTSVPQDTRTLSAGAAELYLDSVTISIGTCKLSASSGAAEICLQLVSPS